MELLFIGLLGGAILAFFIFAKFNAVKNKSAVKTQSTILMEKIKSVCKLVTVEGDFAEIYHYESVKDKFFNLLTGTKKALILIDAKAYIGFDLSKVKLESDTKKKKIILTQFPQPKLLTIETDFKYYDKKDGWLNPFTSSDLTELNKEAKQFIKDKIPQSGLMETAKKEALTAISLMETLAESIGWTLDYSALELDDNNDTIQELKE
ncbi:DUF4230 domain-containing protein [Aquimarina sp. AU474]|uniref:DUF4230 domain-containing protein n=1 Tax=Aquimarina sp. AU474 TaxID=2108529 RepID=UPI000D69DDD9|nr:DUF4230 domain-containing protein [Aquimarina sp. AU474]